MSWWAIEEIERETDRQTGRQTDRLIDRQADRQSVWVTWCRIELVTQRCNGDIETVMKEGRRLNSHFLLVLVTAVQTVLGFHLVTSLIAALVLQKFLAIFPLTRWLLAE